MGFFLFLNSDFDFGSRHLTGFAGEFPLFLLTHPLAFEHDRRPVLHLILDLLLAMLEFFFGDARRQRKHHPHFFEVLVVRLAGLLDGRVFFFLAERDPGLAGGLARLACRSRGFLFRPAPGYDFVVHGDVD